MRHRHLPAPTNGDLAFCGLGALNDLFGGRWWFEPSNLGVYRGHTVAQAVTTMTACAKKVMAPCLPGAFPDEVTCLELDGVRTGCANWTRLICWPQHRRRRASAQLVTSCTSQRRCSPGKK